MTRPNDLWDDMAILNSLYSELCWDHDDIIEFTPGLRKTIRIIIKRKNYE